MRHRKRLRKGGDQIQKDRVACVILRFTRTSVHRPWKSSCCSHRRGRFNGSDFVLGARTPVGSEYNSRWGERCKTSDKDRGGHDPPDVYRQQGVVQKINFQPIDSGRRSLDSEVAAIYLTLDLAID